MYCWLFLQIHLCCLWLRLCSRDTFLVPQRPIQSKYLYRNISFLSFYNLKNVISPQRRFCETGSPDVKGSLWNHLNKTVLLWHRELVFSFTISECFAVIGWSACHWDNNSLSRSQLLNIMCHTAGNGWANYISHTRTSSLVVTSESTWTCNDSNTEWFVFSEHSAGLNEKVHLRASHHLQCLTRICWVMIWKMASVN